MCAVDIIKACKNNQDPNDILFREKSEIPADISERKDSIINDSSLDNPLTLNVDPEKDTPNTLLNSGIEIETKNDSFHKVAASKDSQPALHEPYLYHIKVIEDRIEKIENAQKHARWAISALNFEDISTAISELKLSLNILESI